jgi:hypothetical protein
LAVADRLTGHVLAKAKGKNGGADSSTAVFFILSSLSLKKTALCVHHPPELGGIIDDYCTKTRLHATAN